MIDKKFILDYQPVTVAIASRRVGRINAAEGEGSGKWEVGRCCGADCDVGGEIFGNDTRIDFRFYCR